MTPGTTASSPANVTPWDGQPEPIRSSVKLTQNTKGVQAEVDVYGTDSTMQARRQLLYESALLLLEFRMLHPNNPGGVPSLREWNDVRAYAQQYGLSEHDTGPITIIQAEEAVASQVARQ